MTELRKVKLMDENNDNINLKNPVPIQMGDTASIDAFGRWRVSEPFTIFDSKQLYDKQPLYWNEIENGTGESTFDTNESSVLMSVSADGDYVIRQTYMRFDYQPGKSFRLFLTGLIGEHVANTESKIGYYNTSTTAPYTAECDGLCFGVDGTGKFVMVSDNGTQKKIYQDDWNLDKMDGTGPSGKTVDYDSTQIFTIDFEWLGVGRVRYGFVIDGVVYYIHEENHANVTGNTTPYMKSPNHSVRYEVRSTGGSKTIRHICSSVQSEGGVEQSGVTRSLNTGTSVVSCGTVLEGVLFYRVNTNKKCTTLILDDFSLLNNSSNTNNYRFSIILNPTIAGTALTWDNVTNSAIDSAVGNGDNTLTDGLELFSGYVTGDLPSQTLPTKLIIKPGFAIDGTQDVIAIAVQTFSNNNDFAAALNIREVTCG